MFNSVGISLKIDFCRNDSLVCRARNNLIAKALSDPEVSHVMFIDSDIAWTPIDIIYMLIIDKDVIGGAYPVKNYQWDRLMEPGVIQKWTEHKNASQFRDLITDEELVRHKLMRYNMNLIQREMSIKDNLLEVRHAATGFLLIKRHVIEKMQIKFPQTKYKDNTGFLTEKEMENAYALFETSITDGFYMSEDWTFCERWTKELDGQVFINVGIYLSHTGQEDFRGSLLGSLA
jgi:glycosyltransferase involved in cell wall biosynthesis